MFSIKYGDLLYTNDQLIKKKIDICNNFMFALNGLISACPHMFKARMTDVN